MRVLILIFSMMTWSFVLFAQDPVKKPKWYESIQIGGYMQIRYNGLFETNPDLNCEQCDENWGEPGGGLSFRRLRLKVKGHLSPRVFFYFQPDFAKTVGGSNHVGQLKDAYLDIGLDAQSEFRIRVGQSKVPFGYENMQSSSNRLPLDRNDALNSGVKDERDMGIFFYWIPKEKRELIEGLRKAGLSGGDFGLFAFGIYNGQTANQPDENDEFHVVTRISYPFEIGNQIIEPGIQAYSGKYVVTDYSPNLEVKDGGYLDQRAAVSFVLFPNPFGIQAEYNIGRGPEYEKESQSIQVKSLQGGYATFSYFWEKWHQEFYGFARLQYYDGGKKHELDARSYTVKDLELGMEWHPFPHVELLAEYTISNRRYEDFINPINHQKGSLVRLQAQLKF